MSSTRRKLWKQMGSILLTLVMLLGLLPVSVMAAGATIGIYHSLYEYNPQTQEYVAPSSSYQECKALSSAISAYIGSAKESCDETTYQIKIPSAKNETPDVTKDETGRPQMTYTYQGTTYTWICLGYITKRFDESSNMSWHMWTEEELQNGYGQTVTLGESTTPSVTYIWASPDRLGENAPSEYEKITYTFDFFKPVREDKAVTIQPSENDKINIPKSVDWENSEIKLWGTSKSIYSISSYFQEAIYNGEMTDLTNRLTDGTISITWPKGYYFGNIQDHLIEALERDGEEFNYLYISVTNGLYEWYGQVNSWWDYISDSGTAEMTYYGDGFDEDTTFYSNISDEIQKYLAQPGYVLLNVYGDHILTESSGWSENEFNEVSRDNITFSGDLYEDEHILKKDDPWTITIPAPTATSTGENGEVYLDYTDGTIRWQCVGVQYEKAGQVININHTDWRTQPQITFNNTDEMGRYPFILYIWEEVNWDEPPTMYDVEYEFQLPDELSETSGRRVFPVKHSDDNWGSYDAWDLMSGDGDFNQTGLLKMQDEIKASDVTVREGTTLVILANAPDNYSGYQDFRDFLAFNNNEKIYYEFAGWEDENGNVHQIGDTVTVNELSDGEDTTITLKATWTRIESISEEMYQEAADTLRLQVLSADSDFASPVLVTQWTDTDSNTGTNNKLTGDPVILNEDDTLYYKMSAKLNSGLFGSSDPQHITKGDCVELTFTLDVDPNLEFADSSSMTITYNNPNLKLESTNFGSVSGPDADNNYVVTVNEGSLPTNTDGGLHLTFTVKIINQSETQFNQQAGDPMEFSGFAFKLKDGVKTDGLVIESTANVTGHMDLDKISNAGYHHRFRYYHVRSFLQGDEAQALFGGATDPTAFVHAMQFIDRKLANYDLSQDKMSPVKANTVTAFGSAITIEPADITIYMGGDGGYDAVVGTDGEIASSTNSLPHPLFTIDAPDGVNPEGLTFTNGKTGEEEKTWKLVCANPDSTGTKYYYFQEGDGQDKVRVTYTDGNGTEHISDAFDPSTVHDVYTTYTIALYPGDNDINTITAKDKTNRVYLISANTGTLTVRAVEDSDPTSAVQNDAPKKAVAAGSAVAVEPEGGTTYTLNNTGVPLPEIASDSNPDGSRPSLLFDSIIEDEGSTARTDALEDKVDEKLGEVGSNTTRHYEIKYLDLVDANNGNAWITSSAGTDIYWGYPEGTDTNTAFKLVHFNGLHRDDIGGNSGFDITDISNLDLKNIEIIDVETTENGIKFHVDAGGFSPFALVWETTSGGGGGTTTRYTITAEAGDGGSISPSGRVSVTAGANRTFTITADDGYEIADVIVDDKSVGAVSSYTFEKVRANHTIEAIFEEESGVADPDDTGVSGWLDTDDHAAYLEGYPNDLFGANDNMTRAEVAQMFYNLLLDKDVDITVTFDDVAADAWYADAVNTLASLGMIEGVGNNLFEPERSITRAEFTTIAMRFTKGTLEGENIFPDVNPDDWFYDYVVGSIQYGWIKGLPDGTFGPNNTITRAEVTTIVNRMLDRSADEDYVDSHTASLRQFTDLADTHWAYYDIMEATNTHDYTKRNGAEDWTGLS